MTGRDPEVPSMVLMLCYLAIAVATVGLLIAYRMAGG